MDRSSRYYYFKHRLGVFLIVMRGARWHAQFQGEDLGAYETAQEAANALATGRTSGGSCGDTAALGIPDDLRKWSFKEE
jgi:hypothetical protein